MVTLPRVWDYTRMTAGELINLAGAAGWPAGAILVVALIAWGVVHYQKRQATADTTLTAKHAQISSDEDKFRKDLMQMVRDQDQRITELTREVAACHDRDAACQSRLSQAEARISILETRLARADGEGRE